MLNRKLANKIGKQRINKIDFNKYRYKTRRELLEEDLDNSILNKIKLINDSAYDKDYIGDAKHFALITGYKIDANLLDKEETDILINILTSVADRDGHINENKLRKVSNGLLIFIPSNETNSQRLNAVKLLVNNKNEKENRNLKVKDLIDINFDLKISKKFIDEIKEIVFDTKAKDKVRKNNVRIGKGYKK